MLLYAADVAEMARHGANLGLRHTLERVDWQQLVGRVWKKIDPIAEAGAQYRRSQPHVTVYDAPARFVAPRVLETGGRRITAPRIVLGTGSRPVVPDIPGLDNIAYHTSDTIMRLETQPNSLLIVGGGYIGAEMAHFFGSLGTHVILTDHGGALIKRQDDDVAQAFTRVYRQRFDVLLHTRVRGVHPENGRIAAQLDVAGTPRTVRVDAVLFASGRRPNSDRLNVAAAGIDVDARGRVLTDDGMETNVPGIFAFGDLASRHPLKHVANAEARAIARHLVGGDKLPVEYDGVPNAVFSNPQVASVGLTERDAVLQGRAYLTGAPPVCRHRLRLGHGGHRQLRQADRRSRQPPAARRPHHGAARRAAHPPAGAGHEVRPDDRRHGAHDLYPPGPHGGRRAGAARIPAQVGLAKRNPTSSAARCSWLDPESRTL